MARIEPIDVDNATGKAGELIAGVKQQMGGVPNVLSTMARSPAALDAYLRFGQALGDGELGGALREQIAVAVAGANACGYCASAHTALGSKHGVSDDELSRNLAGDSQDDRTRAAVRFARKLVESRGFVSDEDLEQIRSAGFSDGQVIEIVAVVAINTFTNYFNHVAEPEIDFPEVEVGAPVGR